jgi:hypothetical protein
MIKIIIYGIERKVYREGGNKVVERDKQSIHKQRVGVQVDGEAERINRW